MSPRPAHPFACLVALALICACSNQGEGEICDPDAGNGGNDDCQSGLVCNTGLPGGVGPRCCPSDLMTAKTAVCSVTHQGVTANPAPPEGGPQEAEAPPVDAATEAAVDAQADGAEEPAPEAAAEAGTDAAEGSGD